MQTTSDRRKLLATEMNTMSFSINDESVTAFENWRSRTKLMDAKGRGKHGKEGGVSASGENMYWTTRATELQVYKLQQYMM